MEENYTFQREDHGVLIFIKYSGFDEVTLEVDTNTKKVSKFVCDYIKKVEVPLEQEDMDFLLQNKIII